MTLGTELAVLVQRVEGDSERDSSQGSNEKADRKHDERVLLDIAQRVDAMESRNGTWEAM